MTGWQTRLEGLLGRMQGHLADLPAAADGDEAAFLHEIGVDPQVWTDPVSHGQAGLDLLGAVMSAADRVEVATGRGMAPIPLRHGAPGGRSHPGG